MYPYNPIDTIYSKGLIKRKIDIIKIDYILINKQRLENVYVGILDDMEYDCLLNYELTGGVI